MSICLMGEDSFGIMDLQPPLKLVEVKEFSIKGGEMILVHDGVFHRVHNDGEIDLYMVCIFDGERNH